VDADGSRITGRCLVELEVPNGQGGERGEEQCRAGCIGRCRGALVRGRGARSWDLRDGLVPAGIEERGKVYPVGGL
jgi:hypothetical protein